MYKDQDFITMPQATIQKQVKPNCIKPDTRLQWLGSGRKIRSQTLKQALHLAQKPLCKLIDY